MAKSTSISLLQWLFLLIVIWLSSYYAAVMNRQQAVTIPVRPPASPDIHEPVEWLPPLEEIEERPGRSDLQALERFRGKSVPEIIAEIKGADRESGEPVELEDLRFDEANQKGGMFPVFRDRAHEAGLEISMAAVLNGSSRIGGFDLDGDGYRDIQTSAKPGQPNLQLYRNQPETGGFEKMEEAIPNGSQISAADFDNDGDLDLFVVRDRLPNSLLENAGDGSFEDITEKAGLLGFGWTASAQWLDFDRDGWADLFVARNPEDYESGDPSCRLFHNCRDGSFRDVGWETGLRFSVYVRDCDWGDFDNDGYPDLAVSAFEVPPGQDESLEIDEKTQTPLLVFRSTPSDRIDDWRFESVAEGTGLGKVHDAGRIIFADFDQDGAIDLVTGGGVWNPLRIFRNRGQGQFEEVTRELGLVEVTSVLSMEMADLDGDGFEDLAVGTADGFANRVFLNRGGDTFREVTEAGGFGVLQSTPALASGDFDSDGDIDLLAAVDWTAGALFENPGVENHAWLALDLKGATANRAAIGARVSLAVRDRDWILHRIERVAPGSRIDIGLGEAAKIESLEVEWPVAGWPRTRFSDLPLNRLIKIREGESEFEVIDRKPYRFGGGEEAAKSEES